MLAMTFIVDCVTARRLDDVAVHEPQGGNKRLQSPLSMSLGNWIATLPMTKMQEGVSMRGGRSLTRQSTDHR